MGAPGTQDEVGLSHAPKEMVLEFQVPTVPTGGTNRDMGSLALFLISNWFVNGETVLIDGGVSGCFINLMRFLLTHHLCNSDSIEASFIILSRVWKLKI